MCFDIKPSVAISLNYFTFSGSFSSCLEAAKDGSVWSESIVHGHRQAPVQALLRKNEPPGICLPPHFSSNGIRTTNFSPWAIFFKSAWIMAWIFFFLFISPRRMDYSPVLCPNGYCRFGHFNILDGSWLFFLLLIWGWGKNGSNNLWLSFAQSMSTCRDSCFYYLAVTVLIMEGKEERGNTLILLRKICLWSWGADSGGEVLARDLNWILLMSSEPVRNPVSINK